MGQEISNAEAWEQRERRRKETKQETNRSVSEQLRSPRREAGAQPHYAVHKHATTPIGHISTHHSSSRSAPIPNVQTDLIIYRIRNLMISLLSSYSRRAQCVTEKSPVDLPGQWTSGRVSAPERRRGNSRECVEGDIPVIRKDTWRLDTVKILITTVSRTLPPAPAASLLRSSKVFEF